MKWTKREILKLVEEYLKAEENLKDQTKRCSVTGAVAVSVREKRNKLNEIIQGELYGKTAEPVRESNESGPSS